MIGAERDKKKHQNQNECDQNLRTSLNLVHFRNEKQPMSANNTIAKNRL